MIVTHAHFGEEHFVEACSAGHLAQRTNFNAGSLHVDDEAGEPLVLGQIGVGAADDFADVAVVRARGPHLLSGEHPFIAVTHRLGLQ